MRRPRRLLTLAVAVAAGWLAPAAHAADPLIEGQPFTGVVATFTGAAIPKQVTIDWGDGSPKQRSAVATQPDKSGQVVGTHTYGKLGTYSRVVVDADNPDVEERATIDVQDAPVTGDGTTFRTSDAPAGVTVGSLVDANPLSDPSTFKVSIDWGDGAVTDGALVPVAGSPGRYAITGAHGYPDAASYIVGVSVRSTDLGSAKVDAQTSAEGAPEAAPAVPPGKVLDFGRGETPSLVVDEAGTGHLVYGIPAPGRTGDAVVYCQLPRGARACAVKRTFQVDALTEPVVLRDRDGVLRIVVSYNGVLQIGGGTLVMTSRDGGATWGNTFFRVNTGLFQGSVVDATLSLDGRVLYALFGDFLPGSKTQIFARIGLDRPVLERIDDPGNVGGVPTYSARTVAVLPDGRAVLAGFDTDGIRPDRTGKSPVPRAAIRVMADPDGNLVDQPWMPIRGGVVHRLASSPRGASLMGAPTCNAGEEVLALRGLVPGAPRPIAADGAASCGVERIEDLRYDAAGGRHAVWNSDADGCQGKGPHSEDGNCIVYRRARPGGDFGPKTTVARNGLGAPHGLTVGAGQDGEGWIAWRELGEDGVARVKVTPTAVSSEQAVGPDHRLALKLEPSAECNKSGTVTIGVQAVGPTKGRPTISQVKWSTTPGLTPRNRTDASSPWSTRFSVDRRGFRGLSSTGVLVFSMTVKATVKYRVGKDRETAKLSQVVSFYCGVKFSKVKK